MRNWRIALWIAVLCCTLSSYPIDSLAGHYDQLFTDKDEPMEEPLLEVGALPDFFPSRRQIIDADKGGSCLVCHRMPYPTAPKKAVEHGKMALPSVPTNHPGNWRLLEGGAPMATKSSIR